MTDTEIHAGVKPGKNPTPDNNHISHLFTQYFIFLLGNEDMVWIFIPYKIYHSLDKKTTGLEILCVE